MLRGQSMYKKFGLILAALIAVTALPNKAYSFQNPLKTYDLYADTHRAENTNVSSERETVMGEYYSNSLRPPGHGAKYAAESAAAANTGDTSEFNANGVKRRNQVLRESSLMIYANPDTPPGWTEGPSFYKKPSLESIKTKYKKSNFAGCLQESISYVRQHPSDTLGFYYLAMSYAKVNDKDNAVKAYEKVIALNDNPMIVKYATNGRNCVMGNKEACYENVNVPELIYPYANIAAGKTVEEMTLIDPQTLVNRNMDNLYSQMSQVAGSPNNGKDGDKKNGGVDLPFRNQDENLDKFIRAPYGTGLSPELEKEYKQIQLRKLQQSINNQNSAENDMENVQTFDNKQSQ